MASCLAALERDVRCATQLSGGPAQAPRRRRAFVGGEDLQPIKTRILLMLALTKTSDPVEIQRMFLEY